MKDVLIESPSILAWRFGLIRVPEAIEKKMGKQR